MTKCSQSHAICGRSTADDDNIGLVYILAGAVGGILTITGTTAIVAILLYRYDQTK